MEPYKLIGRMEDVQWQAPILSFNIERHGGTVQGSTRAEIQHWEVNVDELTAKCDLTWYRELEPRAEAVKEAELVQLAQEIAALVKRESKDERINWKDSETVRILVSKIELLQAEFKQTTGDRRRRFRRHLQDAMSQIGWTQVRRDVFQRAAKPR